MQKKLLSGCLVLGALAHPGCQIESKKDSRTDGDTHSANAVVRLTAFSPNFEANATQRIYIRPTAIRFRRQDNGEWLEHPLPDSGLITLRPTGLDLIEVSQLPFPEATYDAVEISLTQLRATKGSSLFFTTASGPMRFFGSFELRRNTSSLLDTSPYSLAVLGLLSDSHLAARWQAAQSTPTDSEPRYHILFVSSATTNGGIGMPAMHALCQTEGESAAANGVVPEGKSWIALLSTSDTAASDRIALLGPVLNSKMELLQWGDNLWDPALDWKSPHYYYADGTMVSSPTLAWTGSNESGGYSGESCQDWHDSSSSGAGMVGAVNQSGAARMNNGLAQNCHDVFRIYCISN